MANDSGRTDDTSPSSATEQAANVFDAAPARTTARARPAWIVGALRFAGRIGLTPFALGLIGILVVAFILFQVTRTPALPFDGNALRNIGDVMAPLMLLAAFIERAVEVLLTPVRGKAVDRVRSEELERHRADGGEMEPAEREWMRHTHRVDNRRWAFLLAVAMGVLASVFGLRGLESLLAEGAEPTAGFRFFDIVVTGLVVGGGADGIHKVVEAFTDYMEKVSRQHEEE